MSSALIVDVHNLYLGSNRNFPGRSVNYGRLVDTYMDAILFKIAYGRQPEEKVEGFAKILRKLGFELRFGGSPYAIDLAVTVAEMVERRAIDHLVLASVAFETLPLLRFVRNHGIYTTVVGFNVPAVFEDYAQVHELTEDFMMVRPNDPANANNVPADSPGGPIPIAA